MKKAYKLWMVWPNSRRQLKPKLTASWKKRWVFQWFDIHVMITDDVIKWRCVIYAPRRVNNTELVIESKLKGNYQLLIIIINSERHWTVGSGGLTSPGVAWKWRRREERHRLGGVKLENANQDSQGQHFVLSVVGSLRSIEWVRLDPTVICRG